MSSSTIIAASDVESASIARPIAAYIAVLIAAEILNAFGTTLGAGCMSLVAVILIGHATLLTPTDTARKQGSSKAREALRATLLVLALVPLASLWGIMLPAARVSSVLWPFLVAAPTLLGVITTARVLRINLLAEWFLAPSGTELALLASVLPLVFVARLLMPDNVLRFHADLPTTLVAIIGVFLLGVVEELLFRGLLLQLSSAVFGERSAVVTMAALSAAAAAESRSVVSVVFLFAVGLGFGRVALRTGSVRGPALAKGFMLAGLIALLAGV